MGPYGGGKGAITATERRAGPLGNRLDNEEADLVDG